MAVIRRGKRFGAQAYHPGGKREWLGTFDTEREAQRAVEDAQSRGPGSSETLAEFAERWPRDFGVKDGKPRWSHTTEQSNTYALKHLLARFGSEKLARFPVDAAIVWAGQQKAGNVKVYRSLFADAVRSRVVPENPFAELGYKRSKGRSQIEAITEDELELLGDCALKAWPGEYGQRMRALVIFQGTVGTRPIGLCSIRSEDLSKGEVYVPHPGKGVPGRTILVPPRAARAVSEMPRVLRPERLFTTQQGKPFNKSSLFYSWNPIRSLFETELDAARARELRDARPDQGKMELHELRHCAATTMRRRGADWEQIAFQLCQTDKGEQARKTYSHLTESDHLSALRRIFDDPVRLRSVDEEAASNG